jgi:hypothetical protein
MSEPDSTEAYAPPRAPLPAVPAAERPRWTRFILGALLTGFLALPVGLALEGALGKHLFRPLIIVGLTGLLSLLGRKFVATVRFPGGVGGAIARSVLSAIAFGFGAFAALFAILVLFGRGRQPRRWGRALLPRLQPGAEWTRLPLKPTVDVGLRAALAAEWRATGRTEHASVAAFARHTLDLMAVGAPPELIRNAQKDALDEIRHAELCFSLARALDGEERSPAPFASVQHAGGLPPIRSLALAKLAVDSMIDGGLHEGVSARLFAATLKECDDPAIQEMIREIVRDEGRHAAHGWRVVEWCLEAGGLPVAMAPARRHSSPAERGAVPTARRCARWFVGACRHSRCHDADP